MNLEICRKGFGLSLMTYALCLPLSMSGTNIALGLIVFFSLAAALKEKNAIRVPRSLYALFIFFLWAAATVWITEKKFNLSALNSFSKSWNLAAMVFIPSAFAWKSSDLKKIFKILFLAACVVVVLGYAEHFLDFYPLGLIQEHRFYGFQSHPLHSGGLYCLLSLTALSLALFDPPVKRERFIWIGAAVILTLGVILTRSRSYYLAWALGAASLLAFKGIKLFIAGILLAGILFLGVAAIDQDFRHRMNSISLEHTDESAKIRLRLWQAARSMIQDHPVAGVGYHKWRDTILEYSKVIPDWTLDQAAFAHAHNSYFTFAAETGLAGLALFLTFWGLLINEQIRFLRTSLENHAGRSLALASIASLLALLLAAFFEHNLLTATISLYLFFLIGLSRAPQEAP